MSTRPRITYLGFFPVLLLLGGGGFLMAYAGTASLAALYGYNALVIVALVAVYRRVFGPEELRWLLINAVLGALGIAAELDWILSLFDKSVRDFPLHVHLVPYLYYVLFTSVVRQLVLDVTHSREDPHRRRTTERWYVALSLLVYAILGVARVAS